MKKDHNLDDLIIDDIKIDNNKGKSVLTIIALLIVLLIMAIIMTRLFLGNDDQNSTIIDQNETTSINAEFKVDNSKDGLEKDKKELEKLSNIMEETLLNKDIASKKDLSLPSEEPKDDTIKPETAQIDESEATASLRSAINDVNKSSEKAETTEQEKTAKAEPKVDSGYIAHKPVSKKHTAKAAAKPEPKKRSSNNSGSGSFYIQVGSFTKSPNTQFVSKIKKNGFRYQLKSGKLLIGPYHSKSGAAADLPKVRSKIISSAFIKHF